MSRSVKKGPFVDARLLGRIEEMNKRNERKVLKTWSRPSVIFPSMIGAIAVRRPPSHAGLRHREHGRASPREFAPTRHYRGHGKATERSSALK
jgi:small subunit ribosomal protein S19